MSSLSNDTPSDPGQSPVIVDPGSVYTVIQGTWVKILKNGEEIYNSSNATADEIDFLVYLATGTYTIRTWAKRDTMNGIMDIELDGVVISSKDWYAAAGAYDIVQDDTGISVTESKLHTLGLVVNGKHASSTGYLIRVQKITLQRTA